MNPQPTTDMPPQRGPAMRSLRSVHDPTPYIASRQHQRRLTHTNCTTEPNAGKSGLTRRAALWETVQVERLARPVAPGRCGAGCYVAYGDGRGPGA